MPDPAPRTASPHTPLSHLDANGQTRMVDVAEKPITAREATAEAFVRCSEPLLRAIRENTLKKGSLIDTARLAGIMAAKRTDELIPLCHTLPLDHIDVCIDMLTDRLWIRATARTTARTGVEMEALTAVTVAALTAIDMGKAIDKAMIIEGVRITSKKGGRSGEYVAPSTTPTTPHEVRNA
ncbi:MAG: cyclic pyranopterin monophosphate synthase MoaC [Phycisphaerales bacterium]|nr:MAG: cyclic pyranopterin monophosphate synthase MoaC [Phycisphaerales bacterium]